MSNSKKLFTIQDSDGRYVSKNSIWYEKETGEWHYTSKGGYKFDRSMKNLDSGVILSNSVEEAEMVIQDLKNNLHKVKNIGRKEFCIKEIV
jgi:hypothetical protein